MEMKIYLYDADYMTKMADIPIFGNTLKYSTLEPVERFEEACYVAPGPIVRSNYDTVLTMTYFRQGQLLQLRLLYKNVTVMDSLESIASCDL